MVTFRAVVELQRKTATGVEVPAEVLEELGGGRRPKVNVTIGGGHTYRTSVGTMGGRSLVPISAEVRKETGVAAGDEVEVTLELDTEVREVVVPDDFAAALAAHDAARTFFEGLPYSQRRWFVLGIEEAKKPETRQRRIEAALARLAEGRGQR